MAPDDDERRSILAAYDGLVRDVRAFQSTVVETQNRFALQIESEIREYKRTVNTAITMLSEELIRFQNTERTERRERQRKTDIKDWAILGFSGCLLLVLVGVAVLLLMVYLALERARGAAIVGWH